MSRLYDRDNYGAFFRAFNEMRLEMPLSLAGVATFKPWAGLRTAYYSRTQGEEWTQPPATPVYHPTFRRRKGDDEYSYAVPFGAELSTRMYTLFGADEQYRLTTEPVVSWTENSRPRLDYAEELFPIDGYDEYYRERKLGFELHTKLQRRSFEDSTDAGVPERDILDFNVALYQWPRRKDRREENDRNRYSDVVADIKYHPTDNLTLSGSIDYDIDEDSANRIIGQADYRWNNYVRTFVTHYHYSGNYGYGRYQAPDPSSQTHFAVRTKLWNDSSRYSLEGAVAYEWRNSSRNWQLDRDATRRGFNKYRVTLFRDLDTFEMSLSYVRDRNADDHGIFFNLSPKAFMGYDRPPPGYSMEIEELGEGRYGNASPRFLEDGYVIDAPARDADIRDVQF